MSKAMSHLFVSTSGAVSFVANAELLNLGSVFGSRAITNDVLEAIRVGHALKADPHHAFPDIVDNYAGFAKRFSLVGGDGKTRRLYQLGGSLNGKPGIFEWIVEPGNPNKVTHRRFIENGIITGKPNQRPKR